MRLRGLLALLFCSLACFAQPAKQRFDYTEARLEQLLADTEKAFNIRYSYDANLVATKKITLAPADYSLDEINTEILKQTRLVVVKIDERYYALHDQIQPGATALKEIVVEGFLSKGISKSSRHFTL